MLRPLLKSQLTPITKGLFLAFGSEDKEVRYYTSGAVGDYLQLSNFIQLNSADYEVTWMFQIASGVTGYMTGYFPNHYTQIIAGGFVKIYISGNWLTSTNSYDDDRPHEFKFVYVGGTYTMSIDGVVQATITTDWGSTYIWYILGADPTNPFLGRMWDLSFTRDGIQENFLALDEDFSTTLTAAAEVGIITGTWNALQPSVLE
jgi:hypothetical protein